MSLLLGKEFFPDLLSIESHFYQFNFIYSRKASAPILVTESGISIDCKAVLLLKAPSSIILTPS